MKRFSLQLASIALATTVFNLTAAVTVTGLRCENLAEPQGVDTPQPRLGWQIQSDGRGAKQTAYQILVASSEAKLDSENPDIWDSGKISSAQSLNVRCSGKPSASRAERFWKVRVWDGDGNVSAWSAPARWTTGILSPEDWKAKWIGQDGAAVSQDLTGTSWIWSPKSGEPQVSEAVETNFFRRVVTIPAGKKIRRALWQYTGDNECRGWLNEFDLGARNNPKTVKWNDITTRLEPGKTYVFGLVGINKPNLKTNDTKPAGVISLLTIEFMDGEPLVIPTDANWKSSSAEADGWKSAAFDDSKWVAARVLGPAEMQPWGAPHTAEDRRQPARWLRKEFSIAKKIARATVSYSGLGLSELYLNGKKVGDEVLSPALAQYDKRVFYVTHDVTAQMKNGANAIGAVLGGGRYYADRSKVYAGTISWGWPKLLLNLHVEFTDGTSKEIVSDESWKLTLDGPIRANSEYDGEEYDARKELGDWSSADYDDSKWRRAEPAAAPAGAVVAAMAEPMRVTGTLKPVAISEPKPGVFIFDMGQNMVGWCRLHVSGAAGTTVQLRHAETLKPDGTLYMANLRGARVTDSYTLRGGGEEIHEPRFTYHGFRYVEVTGFPGNPNLNSIEGRVVNDDLPTAGNFLCSDDLLNRIYTNIVWGTRGNYRSIPTDCPQRDERQGWLGDRSEECRGESYLFDMSKLYAKWLHDIADAQRPTGSLPDVAPTSWPIYSDNVVWPSTLVIAPGVLHQQFGDDLSIAGRYANAKKWLDYMAGFFTNGIIAKDNYGDWCVPPEDLKLIHSKDPARQTSKPLLATSYFFHDLKLMERYAKLLGKNDDATRFAKWADDVKSAFNGKFLDREKGLYDNGSQTSCVLPLAFGLVPEDMVEKVFAHLVDKIENETHGHIGTGLVGGQYLCRVLSAHGRTDLVYRMATQKEYPGWGYMVGQGATTIWELWNGNTADPTMNSGNHVMLVGDLVVWLYENVAGIASDPDAPGFKHIIMKPTPAGDLKFAKATHNSPYGLISSEWHRDGAKFDWQIEIPANTTATVHLPVPNAKLDGQPVPTPLELGSGKYHFTAE